MNDNRVDEVQIDKPDVGLGDHLSIGRVLEIHHCQKANYLKHVQRLHKRSSGGCHQKVGEELSHRYCILAVLHHRYSAWEELRELVIHHLLRNYVVFDQVFLVELFGFISS